MLRAVIFAVCAIWIAGGTAARACIVGDGFLGIIYEDIPADAADDVIVLDVAFSEQTVRESNFGGEVVTARVRHVARGNFQGDTVRVGLGTSSCDYPFLYGRSGLIIGHIITPDEGQALYDHNDPDAHDQYAERWMWPYRETVFVPIPESVGDRRARTGHVRIRRSPD